METNYYDLLWVSKTATLDEIKKAYRKKAMEHHPDRWWDSEVFKKINEAYDVLGNEQKRKEYDTFWRVWWGNPFWNWWWGFSWWFDVDLGDIFEQFFWWWQRWSSKKRSDIVWEDLEYILEIDLKTSIIWWKKTITYDKLIVCDDCHWEWWTGKHTCPECSWKWFVKKVSQTIFWMVEQKTTCHRCAWSWEIVDKICSKCNWQKRIKISHSIDIDIPPWIDEWMVIKLEWEWNAWVKNMSWDLYIRFKVKNSEKNLKRKDTNLYYDLELDVIEAILWTTKELNIPIIWKRNIKIEAWTQVWTVIKLSWDWVAYIQNKDKKWDLFINLNIIIPKNITDSQRECYEKIAKEKSLNVHNKKWLLEKLFW